MVEVTFAQLHGWLVMFLWPFTRIAAFFMASPLWGHSSVPRQAKIGLAALVAVVIAPLVPPLPDVPVMSWAGFGLIVEQIVIGVAMGLVMRVTFAVMMAAGDFIGLKMGLAFATFFDPSSGTNMVVLSRILYMITLLMFLAFNGHLMVLELLARSFATLPIGLGGFNAGAFEMLVRYGGTIYLSGMLLALPVIGPLLIVSLTLGILNRSAPLLTVFNIGFPALLLMGVFLLMVLMTDIGGFLQGLFSTAIATQQQLLEGLAPLPPSS